MAAKLAHMTCILELLLCRAFVGWSPWCTQPPSWLPLLFFDAFLATLFHVLILNLLSLFWLQFAAVFHVLILNLLSLFGYSLLQSFMYWFSYCQSLFGYSLSLWWHVCVATWLTMMLLLCVMFHDQAQYGCTSFGLCIWSHSFEKTFMMWCHHSLLQCHFASQMISINEKSCQNTTLHNQCSSFKTTFKPMCHLQNQTSRLFTLQVPWQIDTPSTLPLNCDHKWLNSWRQQRHLNLKWHCLLILNLGKGTCQRKMRLRKGEPNRWRCGWSLQVFMSLVIASWSLPKTSQSWMILRC